MAYQHQLDPLMERWAHWCQNGQLIAGYGSIMSKMIVNQGVMAFGSGGKAPIVDCIEAEIEAAVMNIAVKKPNVAHLLRVHYGAIHLPGLSLDANNFERSLKMGMCLRTYKVQLLAGRTAVMSAIKRK